MIPFAKNTLTTPVRAFQEKGCVQQILFLIYF